MRILALKEVLDSPSGGWAENWGYDFLTEIQVYSDCGTKLHFFTPFFGNCNLEWCICSVVTYELFLCRHCPWTWSPRSLWKGKFESPERISGCYTHIMLTFLFTQTELLFRDLDFLPCIVQENTNRQCSSQSRSRGVTEQLKRVPGLWDVVPSSTLIWEKKFIKTQQMCPGANLGCPLQSIAVSVQDFLYILPSSLVTRQNR